MDLQETLDDIGGFRRWHVFAFLQITICSFVPFTVHMYGIVFTAWVPPHTCKGLQNQVPNATSYEKKCFEPVNLNISNDIQKCSNGWTYDSDGYNTIITEFQLVCDKDYYFDVSAAIISASIVITSLFGSYLVDRYGRKRVHVIMFLISPIFSCAAAFAPNFWSYVLLKCLASVFVGIADKSGCTLLFELYGPKTRAYPGIGLEFIWTLSILFPCLLGYLCKEWRTFQLVGSLAPLALLPGYLFIVESPTWFHARKRYDETREVINKMIKWNGLSKSSMNINLDKIEQSELVTKESNSELMVKDGEHIKDIDNEKLPKDVTVDPDNGGVPLRDLFCDSKLRMHLIICTFFIFASELVYTGLTLSSPSFGPNRFVNYVLFAVIEIPATPLTLLLVNRFGRKIPLTILFILAGIPLLIIAFIPQKPEYQTIILSLAVAGKFGNISAFSIAYLYLRELFPTTLRDSSASWSFIGGGIGMCMSPLAAYLAKKVFWVPNMLFAVVSIIAGITVMPLPETSNKPLPETTQDVYVVLYGQNVKDKQNQISS